MVLEEVGFTVHAVNGAALALEVFQERAFELVVTDFKMPGMNGIELIAALRALAPTLPIILLSGYVDALGLTEKSTGANAVIMKSANEISQLVRTATRLIDLKPARKPPSASSPRPRRKAASS
jgi:CheY-like chemotaxis protein